ncbi:hypothetical protein HGM15179_014574 [Zosterops borbonicus]|uniref:Uncharacterized protein n=1 Tax=Zosterops borbonicus TaxID=364589 RepID=A0A8K1G6U0_9PASS|nr:hypothetical protein HGM15179_014574 [Zosterops borbonicus]
MDNGVEGTLRKSASDTKLLEQFFHPLERWDVIHRGLGRPERWVHVNLMNFNVAKYQVLHLGQDNPKRKYRLSREWTQSSSGKDFRVLVYKKLYKTCNNPAVCSHGPENQMCPGLHQN